jgi:hypothetical protein
MADIRKCDQCGTSFTPRREHARFCSARCRARWNRRYAGGTPPDTSALDWSITAMRETIGRLCRAGGWDRADGFAVISEAVWRVTIVDAALVRYHPETYSRALARQDAGQRRIVEETFAGLRFVRNRMGYDAHPADLVQPLDSGAGIAAWTWKPVPEPALGALTPRGRAWELTRYRAYQAQLASRTVGEIFTQAVAFLDIADDVILSRTYP